MTIRGRWDGRVYTTTQLDYTTEWIPTNYQFNPKVSQQQNPFPEYDLLVQAIRFFTNQHPSYRGYQLQLETLEPLDSRGNPASGTQLGLTKYNFQLHRPRPCPPAAQ